MRGPAIVALALAACDKPPPPPDQAAFAKMTASERCEATAPRGDRCPDELLAMQLRQLGSSGAFGSDLNAIEAKLRDSDEPSADEARAMYLATCLGDRDLASAVLACWDVRGCDAFVACVGKRGAAP